MKKIATIVMCMVAGMIVFISCKRYTDEFYGPGLGLAPDNFTASALTPSDLNPNFSTGKMHFTSTFNATVRWKLTLTGRTSGAIKLFEGLSKDLSVSNTEWDGSTDTIKLFRQGEDVDAVLTVLGWKESSTATVKIANTKSHGFIIGSFDNINVNNASRNWQDPTPPNGSGYWWFYSFDANELVSVDKVVDPSAPQGSHAIKIIGKDVNTSYFIGQIGLSAPNPPGIFNFGSGDLSNMYFNYYVKGAGTEASKDYKFVVQVFEDDNSSGTILYDGSEDKYIHEISLKYEGWKLHTIKYTDFVLDAGPPAYRSHTPSRIAGIGFFFGAKTSAGLSATVPVEVSMDYFTITTDGPMVP